MGRFADMAEEIRAASDALDELARKRAATAPTVASPSPVRPATPAAPAIDTAPIIRRLDALDRRLQRQGQGGSLTPTGFRSLVGLGD